jgi:lipopolysaccharide assembly protein A
MRLVIWLVRAALFFVLFAFALNNLDVVTIRWFFGREWHTPMVFIVLAAFGLGCAFGVFAMVPSWWRHRRVALRNTPATVHDTLSGTPTSVAPTPSEHPPRDGL